MNKMKQEWYIFFVFMILYMLYRNTQKHTLMMLSGPSFHFYFFVSGLKCKWSLRRLECRACFLLTSEMESVSLGLPRLSIGFAWVAWPGFFTMTMTETYVYNIYTGICQVESRCELFDGSVLFCQSRCKSQSRSVRWEDQVLFLSEQCFEDRAARGVWSHIWDCLSFSILSFAQVAPPCVEWCNVLYVDLSEELVGDCDLDCSQSLF